MSTPNLSFQNTVDLSRQQKAMVIDLWGSSRCYGLLVAVAIILIPGSWWNEF